MRNNVSLCLILEFRICTSPVSCHVRNISFTNDREWKAPDSVDGVAASSHNESDLANRRMITYHRSPFGLALLFRLHGSAVYRAMLPALVSVLIYCLIHGDESRELNHPYAIGVLVANVTFLLVFRVQIAYGRYWEAASSVHHMMSKWMDATSHTGSYHLQCKHYNKIKPPSFFEYPTLDQAGFTRGREAGMESERLDTNDPESVRIGHRAVVKSIEKVELGPKKVYRRGAKSKNSRESFAFASMYTDGVHVPLEGMPRLDGNWGSLFPDGKATHYDPLNPSKISPMGFASTQGGRTPPLFLQELAHLSSLLVAVALSTLRNDIEGAESPLDYYEPGSPWPAEDPDKAKNMAFFSPVEKWTFRFFNFLGFGRSQEERTRYNASRPLPVLGGISAAEIRFLQMARGPYAKTQLCWSWLSEFVIREHLAGSTGDVGPPIISRVIQFLGDGMIYYNHARKIMSIPFPFPHAQLSALFLMVLMPAIAFLMDNYAQHLWVGSLLTFATVTALVGIHEVARELENPFRNMPNELPLVFFMAQYNEALLTMYAGYHPDHFWRDEADRWTEKDHQPVVETKAEKTPDWEATVEKLLAKLDAQGAELERLRKAVDATDGEEKKMDPVRV